MLNYFPKYFTSRAIYCYLITLALVSMVFMNHAMPFQFMLFGLVSVTVFFMFSNRLTMKWRRFKPETFTKKLFLVALIIRVVYVLFIYFYYLAMTGEPHAFHAGDEYYYQTLASIWRSSGFEVMKDTMSYEAFSDSGYAWWLGFEYLLFGTHVLVGRFVKCLIDTFSCILVYNLAKRNFGEAVGRMAAIFCMLMPNMWYYCGVTLKETEMAFLTVLFAERADLVFHSPKIKLAGLILPGVCILVMFTFRTALGSVMFAALAAALIFTSKKQLEMWKKVLYSAVFAIWMFMTVGVEMVQETQTLWENRDSNQELGYEWRAARENGNTFAQYATASVFAPLIFTIPFSSMVAVSNQENQMMMNGANFIKNIMSGLTIFAMFIMLFSGDWRKHVLPIALTCGYLVVLVFSNFAHSERFHFPVLALELMFAAFGVTQLKNKHKRWFTMWLVGVCVANVIWAWIKLAGRGLA